MKRMLSFISAIALTTTLVQANSVESQNIVGYINLPVKGGTFNMLAVNWDEIGGGEIHIQDLFSDISGLQGGFGLGDSDRLMVWDAETSNYDMYFLYDSGGMYPGDGTWQDSVGIADETFAKGSTFWLLSTGTDTDLTVAGQVPTTNTVEFIIRAGTFNMIAAAYSADLPLNSGFDWLTAGATGGFGLGDSDRIMIWDAETSNYDMYFLYNSGGMYPGDGTWQDSVGITTDVLPMGKGAWYLSADVAHPDNDWVWVQNRPY